MRTSFGAIDILWKRANEALFKSSLSLTGDIYKQSRPLDSDKEDVVINSLGLNNEDVQRGVLNINIHVPNLNITIGGKEDNTQPDYGRLQQLTGQFISQFDDVFGDDVWFFVQQDSNIIQDTEGRHYANLRIAFNAVNTEGHIPSQFLPTAPGGETDPVYESEKEDIVFSRNNQW